MGEGWSFKNAIVMGSEIENWHFSKNWFSFYFRVFFVPVYFSFRASLKVVFVAFLFVLLLVK